MKILLAPDKFKGSLNAMDVCKALEKGLRKTNPNSSITICPLADGGDGSLAVLQHYIDLQDVTMTVQDPLGRSIEASYKKKGTTAFIELSAASGLVLLSHSERSCMDTSSYGTGQLIADAIAKGASLINLFIGGSATNDGGIGIACALGYQFYDSFGNLLKPIGKNLALISKIDNSQVLFNPTEKVVRVICDVSNPLVGVNGAAHVYGLQKGASPEEIVFLDHGLSNLAARLVDQAYPDVLDIPGAGAAGGVGGGCIAFLSAQIVSGISTFIEIAQLEIRIKDCDLIITGEGKFDAQTKHGKVVSGVCALANKYGKKCIVVCGDAEKGIAQQLGVSQIYTILSRSPSLEVAMSKATEKLSEIGSEILRVPN